ncbi:hypothetical protein KUCAC02_004852, partial [Chaenocephalus aceratus]
DVCPLLATASTSPHLPPTPFAPPNSQLWADGGWSHSRISPSLLLCLRQAERHSLFHSPHPSFHPLPELALM